ncbi:MAG TPA: 2-C-methyl-D-erythritol 4-phosphate cytidylyltransferase [Trueperaceae bacterium]
MTIAALIPAAGQGSRLGRGPKAFVELGGRTLLERAVTNLGPFTSEIVVAVPPGMQARASQLLGGRARLVAGGDSRQESVHALLCETDADLVLIHDAARPFVPAVVVRALLDAVERSDAATAVAPVADSLLVAATGETLERSRVRAVQTPQGFRRALVLEAHRHARAHGVTATDDAALVRDLGHEVALVPGSPWLMKVTTPQDLRMAEALALAWDREAGHARA